MEHPSDDDRRRAPRRDALRSHEAILTAARELFAESADVSMLAIARRAGVGQATLYRHFPDRAALAEVLASEVWGTFEAAVDEAGDGPDALERILRATADLQVRLAGFVPLLREGLGDSGSGEVTRASAARMLAAPLARAQEAGRIRADVELDDVLAITRMLEGPLADAATPAERRDRGARLIELILRGMRA